MLAIQPLLRCVITVRTRRIGAPSLLARVGIGLACGVVAYMIMTTAAWTHAAHRSPLSPLWLLACIVALTIGVPGTPGVAAATGTSGMPGVAAVGGT